jgi:hypothetical protein
MSRHLDYQQFELFDPLLQSLLLIQCLCQCADNRIRQTGVFQRPSRPCQSLGPGDPPRHSDDGCAGRHRFYHHRASAYLGALTDLNRAQHRRACADDDVVTNYRVPLPLLQAGAPQDGTSIHQDIITDFRGLSDHNAHAMVDEEATANLRSGVYLNASKPAVCM